MAPHPVALVLDDRYELGEQIGAGAMGTVHRGWDRRLGRHVAVKLLRPDLAADPDVRARFEEEARAAAGLTHPAIVMVFDSGECDGVPYIVMECLPGRTLADDLTAGPLPADAVQAIGVDLAGALATAHAAGVLHRDVKPANVLRTETGGVKLADFGIAKSAESASALTITGTVLGTPAYLAPERLEGRSAAESSDVYALGVVLYEALTGEPAFPGDTPVAVAHAVSTRSPVPLAERMPGLDPAVASGIDSAMARQPDDRPASALALGALLAGSTATATAAAPTASAATTTVVSVPATSGDTQVLPAGAVTVDPVPERRVPWAVVAVVAILVVALFAGWQASRGGDGLSDGVVSGDTTTTSAPTTTATTAPPTTAPPTTEAPAPPADPGGNGNGNGHGHEPKPDRHGH